MKEEKQDKVYWLVGSKEAKPYDTTTWYRCHKLQEFLELVEKKDKIVAIIASGNNIGFILDKKTNHD